MGECQTRGWLKRGGRQRTDATRVLGALRQLNRLECVAETLRQALNALATMAPSGCGPRSPGWFDRYGARVEDARLPTSPDARQRYAEVIGADGRHLLTAITAPEAPAGLRESRQSNLRRVWVHQYEWVDGHLRWRDPKNSPPPAQRLDTPYEPEARYGTKRTTSWVGYKVHLTESCDEDSPHLVTHVETTTATTSDVSRVTPIHDALARHDRLRDSTWWTLPTSARTHW